VIVTAPLPASDCIEKPLAPVPLVLIVGVIDWLNGPAGDVASNKFGELLLIVSVSLLGGFAPKVTDPVSVCRFIPRVAAKFGVSVGATETVTGTVTVLTPAEVIVKIELPTATPVTGICALSPPAGTVTLAGTVAAAVLLLKRLNVMPPAGAGALIFNWMFVVRVAFRLSEVGLVDAVTVTCTDCASGANPVALAVMLTVPIVTPVTCGLVEATVAPPGTKTLAVTVAMAVLALVKFTVTPPVGAGEERLNAMLLA